MFSRCVLLVFLILGFIPVFCSYDKVYMGHEPKKGHSTCSKIYKKSIGGEISGLVRPYEQHLNCTVNIEAPIGTMININIINKDFVTAKPDDCYSVKLLVYDGPYFETSNIIPSFPNGLCNQSMPSHTVHTRSNKLSLRFEVTDIYEEVSFTAVYTSYTTIDDGSCAFCSAANEMCIPEELLCDGLANCADSSDEDNCETDNKGDTNGNATWIIVSVIIVLVLLVTTIIVAVAVYRRHKARTNTDTTNISQEPVYYNSEYGPSTSRHWIQPPPNATDVVTPDAPSENEHIASNAYSSAVAGPLPDQPPSYERSLQDAADEEQALKRALAQER